MKNLVKTIRTCVSLVLLGFLMGCPNPDDDVFLDGDILMDDEGMSLELLLTIETEEDQIGAIASNATAIFNDQVWSVGGNRPGTRIDQSDIWRSENGIAWVSVAENPFAYRTEGKLILYNGKLWLVGGRDLDGNAIAEVWSSETGLSWNLVTNTPAFGAAVNHDVVVFDNRLFLIARNIDFPENTSVWSSTDGIDWQLEAENAFTGREEFSAVVFDGAIYVLGGFDPTDASLPITNEIWTSTNGADWSKVETNTIFQSRYAHTATVYKNKVFVAGGIGTASSSLGIQGNLWYSEDMVNWFEYEPFRSDIGVAEHSALVFEGKLWLFFGIEGGEFPEGEQSSRIVSILEE